MRERIAASLLCLVAMLTWEAFTALPSPVPLQTEQRDASPLVALSQGIVGVKVPYQGPAPEPLQTLASDQPTFEWVEDMLPVVAAPEPCEPVVIATACSDDEGEDPSAAGESSDDAGVSGTSHSQLTSDTASSGKPG
jgi:hypothetical protein